MGEEKTHSQMRQEFYKTFNTKILPIIKKYETERKEAFKKALLSTVFLAAITITVIVVFVKLNAAMATKESNGLQLGLVLFLMVCTTLPWLSESMSFEHKMKEKIMPLICDCFCKMSWSSHSYNYAQLFKASRVIPNFDNANYDDVFRGVYKDIKFDIVESEFEKAISDKHIRIFKGVIVKLDMNKRFHSHTVIKPKSFLLPTFVFGLNRTILEDVQFEKKYNVYTNDPVNARYLITPTFMEKLNNIKTAFQARKIGCAFYKDKFYLTLSTNKNLFQFASLVKPLDSAQQYFTAFNEIFSILTLIDYFKLDQKTGL